MLESGTIIIIIIIIIILIIIIAMTIVVRIRINRGKKTKNINNSSNNMAVMTWAMIEASTVDGFSVVWSPPALAPPLPDPSKAWGPVLGLPSQ